MKKNRIVSVVLILCVLLSLSGCGCKHEWKAATCTEPSTCTKCGETQGEPLGHDGTWKVTKIDNISATKTEKLICTRCDEELDSRKENLQTFIENGAFTFTGEEFVERLQGFWDEEFAGTLDLKFKYAVNSMGLINFDIYNQNDVWLGWGVFYDANGEAIKADADDTTVYSMRVIVGPVSGLEIEALFYLLQELIGPCVRAVDPSITDSETYKSPISNNNYNVYDGTALNGLHYSCGYDKDNGTLKFDIDIAE